MITIDFFLDGPRGAIEVNLRWLYSKLSEMGSVLETYPETLKTFEEVGCLSMKHQPRETGMQFGDMWVDGRFVKVRNLIH